MDARRATKAPTLVLVQAVEDAGALAVRGLAANARRVARLRRVRYSCPGTRAGNAEVPGADRGLQRTGKHSGLWYVPG